FRPLHLYLSNRFHPFLISLLLISTTFFLFNATSTTHIYTLSLHDALPISHQRSANETQEDWAKLKHRLYSTDFLIPGPILKALRSEEHTFELQSPYDLVCRLLLEKKKKKKKH